MNASLAEFSARLRCENHTLKRSLTDPRLMSGIGNAYSDEILHRAKLSPLMLSSRISDEQVAQLFDATRSTLAEWTDRLRAEAGDTASPKRSPPFTTGWRCMGASGSRARRAVRRCSASATPRTRPTTARAARPADACWPTGACRACSRTTGPAASTSGKHDGGRSLPCCRRTAGATPTRSTGCIPWCSLNCGGARRRCCAASATRSRCRSPSSSTTRCCACSAPRPSGRTGRTSWPIASRAMRQILVDRARRRQAQRRGGGWQQTTLGDAASPQPVSPDELIALDDALDRLGAFDRAPARRGGVPLLRRTHRRRGGGGARRDGADGAARLEAGPRASSTPSSTLAEHRTRRDEPRCAGSAHWRSSRRPAERSGADRATLARRGLRRRRRNCGIRWSACCAPMNSRDCSTVPPVPGDDDIAERLGRALGDRYVIQPADRAGRFRRGVPGRRAEASPAGGAQGARPRGGEAVGAGALPARGADRRPPRASAHRGAHRLRRCRRSPLLCHAVRRRARRCGPGSTAPARSAMPTRCRCCATWPQALAYAHAAGVVHRDLKPANVLCAGAHAFLMDFGVAKLVQRSAVTMDKSTESAWPSAPRRTWRRSSAQRLPILDHKVDLYAWGLLAAESLTGRRPQAPEGRRLRDLGDAPPAVAALVSECLATDPAARPADADTILRRLEARHVALPAVSCAFPHERLRAGARWKEEVMVEIREDLRDNTVAAGPTCASRDGWCRPVASPAAGGWCTTPSSMPSSAPRATGGRSLQCAIPDCYLCSVRPERPLMRAGSPLRGPATRATGRA